MAFFGSLSLASMEQLFAAQLKLLYDGAIRMVDALPRMSEAATAPELKAGLDELLAGTRTQVRRLEEAFAALGQEPERDSSAATRGLIEETHEFVRARGDDGVRDAALIAAAQEAAHHAIAAYGSARAWARHLGREDVAELLQRILEEHKLADRRLTELAESGINALATR